MNAARATLPDLDALNPHELKALIVSQHELIVSRDSEIEQLKLLIAKLRRMHFGRSSEKLDRQIEQLEPRLEALQLNDAEKVAALLEAIKSAEPVARPVRRPLAAHLPREVRTYPPKQEACPDCGGKLKHLSEDVLEMLEIEPARFKVIRQVRPKLACTCCDRIVQAEAESADRTRCCGPGTSRACAGLEIWRSLAVVPEVGDLCSGRSRARSLHVGRLGERSEPAIPTVSGSIATSRDGGTEVAR